MADSSKKKPPADKAEFQHMGRPYSEAIQFASKSILVKVGKPITLFHVDEKLICDSSPFFAAALKKEWREGQRRTVELPEEEAESFNIYMNWLYRRQIALLCGQDETMREEKIIYRMVDAYSLGEMLLDADFKDAICDVFAVQTCEYDAEAKTHWVPHPDSRRNLYQKTSDGSQLRKLLTYRMAQTRKSTLLSADDDPAFLLDLAKHQIENTKEEPGTVNVVKAMGRCTFHEHKAGNENCYRKKYANITTMSK